MTHHHHPPATEAGAIIAHYLRNLTIAQGRRWNPANDRDMQRLTELLGELGISGESIPAFTSAPAAPERTAVENPAATDPQFARWKREREQDDDRAVTRMTRGGAK